MGSASGISFTRKGTKKDFEPGSSYLNEKNQNFTLGQTSPPPQKKNSKTPFIKFEYVKPARSTGLEPGFGLSGISDKTFQNYSMQQFLDNNILSNQPPTYHQIMTETRFFKSSTKIGHVNTQPTQLQDECNLSSQAAFSYHFDPSSALEFESLQNKDLRINADFSQVSRAAPNLNIHKSYKVTQNGSSDVGSFKYQQTKQTKNIGVLIQPSSVVETYQNQHNSEMSAYGRQNSDQTAYIRNMRSVLHQNGLQQKNNFINIGTYSKKPSSSEFP